jgi:HAD superfamily hydrolase (TIGR01549 family)
MYNCIIFDIDGTILDTREASLLAVQKAYFEESGKLLPPEEFDFSFRTTTRNTAKILKVRDADRFISNIDRQYQFFSDRNRIFDGMEDVIRRLFEQNIYMGVVTSKSIWEYEHDFTHFNLSRYFGQAVCVEHTPKHKPAPEPLYKFFELSGQKSETSLYIGDSSSDALCAKSAGVDFALAKWGAIEDIAAKYYLDKPEELFDIL